MPWFHSSKTIVTSGWEDVLRSHGLGDLEAVYRCAAGDVYVESRSVEVRAVPIGAGLPIGTGPASRQVFIKKYWVHRAAQLWSGMFRGTFFGVSKARQEFENLRRLREWQLDAPQPVAFGEERWAGWLLRSFLISEAVPSALPLHLYIRDHLPRLKPEEAHRQRAELITNLAAATRRMHAQRFVHHDYFWRNILLAGTDIRHFFVIDAHKGRRWYPGEAASACARDLAALDAPAPRYFRRSERLRFFLLYCGRRRLDCATKRLLRRALRLAEPLREKQLHRVLRG